MCGEDTNCIRINKDDIRVMLGGNYTSGKESLTLKTRDNLIQNAILLGKNVIEDDTNYNPIHLDSINAIVESMPQFKNRLIVEVVDFDTPVDECIKRDSKETAAV